MFSLTGKTAMVTGAGSGIGAAIAEAFAAAGAHDEASGAGDHEQMRIGDLTRRMRELEEGLRHVTPDWEERMARWEDSVRTNQPAWHLCEVHHVGENSQRYDPRRRFGQPRSLCSFADRLYGAEQHQRG